MSDLGAPVLEFVYTASNRCIDHNLFIKNFNGAWSNYPFLLKQALPDDFDTRT